MMDNIISMHLWVIKASTLLGKGELICEAREIFNLYLQYQTYSADAVIALDGDAKISASGNNLFTIDDDNDDNDDVEEKVRSSFITVDM